MTMTETFVPTPIEFAKAGQALNYQSGFGNGFETEALPGALPIGRNSPQRPPYGLYAEQLSGSPFTAPQATNQRSWLYRIRPTVLPDRPLTFVTGLHTMTAAGDAEAQAGMAAHVALVTRSMDREYFFNA